MRTLALSLFISMLFILFSPRISQPCTTFLLNSNEYTVFGKNYDWQIEYGLVIINKRNVSKSAEGIDKEYGPPASWTSKYGSLTFNQYGREMPMGGINETGLVVESMALMNCTYPSKDDRPAISTLQWIQYQLDTCSKVEDVIANNLKIRLYEHSGEVRCHFLVGDKEGNCATIEFINGKMVCHTKGTLPIKVLTNDIYSDNLENLKMFKEFGGNISSRGSGSLDRFARAANMVKNYTDANQLSSVDYAFSILENVAQPGGWQTEWSIVYNIQKLRIYFRTISNKKLRYIDLPSFDFSCKSPVKVMDINLAGSGDMKDNFSDYTRKVNLDLIRRSYKETNITAEIPDEILEHISKYPERTTCNQK